MSGFEEVFKIRRATLTETAPIRHAVYCDELSFECKTPDGNECDAHDGDSQHCIVLTPKDEPIGCVRVIAAKHGNNLPFQRYCDVDIRQFRKNTVGEVSRLAILKDRRSIKQPGFPFILPALYMASLVMAEKDGISTLFIECEQKMVAHFRRIGASVTRVSEFHDHNGSRAAYTFSTGAAAKELCTAFPPLWDYVSKSIGGLTE